MRPWFLDVTLAAAPRRGAPSRSPVRRWSRRAGCALAALAVLVACAPAEAKDASPASAPPPELLVSVSLGPVTSLRGLQAYVEAIKPGAGGTLSDQVIRRGLADAVGATSLDGLDPVSGLYLLIGQTGDSPAMALLGKVSDARKLEASAGKERLVARGGWAVIGPRPLIDRVAPYGFAAIAPQPAPRAPTATVYVPHVLARFKTQIEEARQKLTDEMSAMGPGAMTRLMTSYVDGLYSLATDTDRFVATLEAAPDQASLDLALVPRPGTRLAEFVRLQRPSDFALLGRLPEATPTVLFAGHLELGAYHAAMMSAIASLYIPEAPQDLVAAFDLLRKVMTGEVAMMMQIAPKTGMEFTQVYTVTDARAADRAFVTLLDMFKAGRTIDLQSASFTLKSSPATTSHAGVTLRSYDTTFDTSKMSPLQLQAMSAMMPQGTQHVFLGAFDNLAVVVSARDGAAEVHRAIDAARGKGARLATGTLVDPLLAAARARKDSLVMVMDLGGLLGSFTGKSLGAQPIVMGFGAAGRTAHLRFSVPVATARALGAMGGGKP